MYKPPHQAPGLMGALSDENISSRFLAVRSLRMIASTQAAHVKRKGHAAADFDRRMRLYGSKFERQPPAQQLKRILDRSHQAFGCGVCGAGVPGASKGTPSSKSLEKAAEKSLANFSSSFAYRSTYGFSFLSQIRAISARHLTLYELKKLPSKLIISPLTWLHWLVCTEMCTKNYATHKLHHVFQQ